MYKKLQFERNHENYLIPDFLMPLKLQIANVTYMKRIYIIICVPTPFSVKISRNSACGINPFIICAFFTPPLSA